MAFPPKDWVLWRCSSWCSWFCSWSRSGTSLFPCWRWRKLLFTHEYGAGKKAWPCQSDDHYTRSIPDHKILHVRRSTSYVRQSTKLKLKLKLNTRNKISPRPPSNQPNSSFTFSVCPGAVWYPPQIRFQIFTTIDKQLRYRRVITTNTAYRNW